MAKHNLVKQSNTGIKSHKANENIMRLKFNANKPIQTKFFRENEFIVVDKNKVQNIIGLWQSTIENDECYFTYEIYKIREV